MVNEVDLFGAQNLTAHRSLFENQFAAIAAGSRPGGPGKKNRPHLAASLPARNKSVEFPSHDRLLPLQAALWRGRSGGAHFTERLPLWRSGGCEARSLRRDK